MTLGLFAALSGLSSAAQAADGTWNVDANGVWSNSANWLNGIIADGANSTANFTFDITATRTVTNDTLRTIGNINFDDLGTATSGEAGWVIAGTNAFPLTLSTTSGTSTINTSGFLNFADSFVISALLTGTNNVVFNSTNSNSGSKRQYAVTNPANTYSGTTTIQNGFLRVGANSILAAGSPLGISSSAIILGNANTTANTAGGGTAPNLALQIDASSVGQNLTIDRNLDSSTTVDNLGRTDLNFIAPTNATGTLTVSGGWILGAGATRSYGFVVQQPGSTINFTGPITGGGTSPLRINDFGGGLGTVRLASAASNFTNQITIEKGRLLIGNNALSGTGVAGALGANATVNVGSSGVTAAGDVISALIDGAFTVGKTMQLNTNGGGVSANVITHVLGGTQAVASTYSGPVPTTTIATNRSLNVSQVAGGTTTFSGLIGPNGTQADANVTNLDKVGAGTAVLGNAAGNTYDGTTRILAGTLLANNTSGSATGTGAVNVGVVTPAVGGQSGNTINTSTTATLTARQINGISNAVAANLQLGETVSGTGITAGSTIIGIALGSGAGSTSSIAISTTFVVPINTTTNFTDLAFGAVATTTGTLGGAGIITGPVIVNSGSTLSPGSASTTAGILKTGALTLGGTLQADVNGAAVGTGYDQVDVTGTVTLGATLAVNVGSSTATGGQFILINNDGTDAVSGTFAGLAEGATVTSGGRTFTITYVGGSGNDVALTESSPSATSGAIISEFRFHGATGPADEYVELLNITGAPLDISNWSIQTRSATGLQTTTVPAGTIIPTFGHFLFTGSGTNYSLTGYGTGNSPIAADMLDNSGVALFNAAGTLQDAVGFVASDAALREGAGLPAYPTANGEYTFMRDFIVSQSKNTSDSSNDFVFVSTTGTGVAGETAPGTAATVAAQLGAPSPEGLTSPNYFNNQTISTLLDPSVASGVAPNRARITGGGTLGTLIVRRTIKNNTNVPITRLRLSVTSITSLNSAGFGNSAQADVRLVSGGGETGVLLANGTTMVNTEGTTLEAGTGQPQQPLGGGLGSSINFPSVTLGAPLMPGASRNYNFRLQIERGGSYFIALNILALTQ